MKPTDATSGEEVSRAELVEGYEVDRGRYVTVTDQEIRDLRIPSNGAIQIERFVAQADIDGLCWDAPYYLVPDGTLAQEPFAVLREALREEGQVALARVVMNARERQFALEPRGNGIIACAIRSHKEVRDSSHLFDAIPNTKPGPGHGRYRQADPAAARGAFDPTSFVDRYQQAVMELVECKKVAGHRAAGPAPATRCSGRSAGDRPHGSVEGEPGGHGAASQGSRSARGRHASKSCCSAAE